MKIRCPKEAKVGVLNNKLIKMKLKINKETIANLTKNHPDDDQDCGSYEPTCGPTA